MNTLCKSEFIDEIEHIPPLPAIVGPLLSVTGSPRSSARDVARVLRRDPMVAARILRVVNSPFYRASRQISELDRAVTRLGTTAVRHLVLGICVRDTLSVDQHQRPDHEALWWHATAVGAACELIARRLRFWTAEAAFVAGLLHDVGHLAMLMLRPDAFRAVLTDGIADYVPLSRERDHFGIDHAEAGFRILAHWQLPEQLCQVVQHHHAIELDELDGEDHLLAVVVFADILAHVAGFGGDRFAGTLARAEMAAQRLSLSPADQVEILGHLGRRVQEAGDMLGDTNLRSAVSRRSERRGKVLWICDSSPPPFLLALLEHRGHEVRVVHPSSVDADAWPDDLLLMVSASDEDGTPLQSALPSIREEHSRTVFLREPDQSGPTRQRDPKTGTCQIPRLFTAFDMDWVEQQLQL